MTSPEPRDAMRRSGLAHGGLGRRGPRSLFSVGPRPRVGPPCLSVFNRHTLHSAPGPTNSSRAETRSTGRRQMSDTARRYALICGR